jgi:hypothetical protein
MPIISVAEGQMLAGFIVILPHDYKIAQVASKSSWNWFIAHK